MTTPERSTVEVDRADLEAIAAWRDWDGPRQRFGRSVAFEAPDMIRPIPVAKAAADALARILAAIPKHMAPPEPTGYDVLVSFGLFPADEPSGQDEDVTGWPGDGPDEWRDPPPMIPTGATGAVDASDPIDLTFLGPVTQDQAHRLASVIDPAHPRPIMFWQKRRPLRWWRRG